MPLQARLFGTRFVQERCFAPPPWRGQVGMEERSSAIVSIWASLSVALRQDNASGRASLAMPCALAACTEGLEVTTICGSIGPTSRWSPPAVQVTAP